MADSAALTHHDAFALDIHTLSLLLHRNRYQHRRCIYYRRSYMVLTALARLLPSYQNVLIAMGQWREMVDTLMIARQEKKMTNKRTFVSRVNEEYWTLENVDTINSSTKKNDDDSTDDIYQTNVLQQMIALLHQLKILATQSIPQLLSRIIHASPPILHEISRGYFVPFHTVAIACLARIHSLLMKLGREVVTVLQETVPQLRHLVTNEASFFGTSGKGSIVDNTKKFHDLVLETFVIDGFEVKSTKKKPAILNSGMPSPSNEWNNLIQYFMDVNQDEITKQINEYVKDKRWQFAMRKLGMVNGVSKTLLVEQQLESEEKTSSTCDDSPSYHDKSQTEFRREGRESLDVSMCSDMGELVNVQPGHDDLATQNNASLKRNVLDQNMARIMKGKAYLASKLTVESSKVSESEKKKKMKEMMMKREQKSVAHSVVSSDVSDRPLYQERNPPADGPCNIDVFMDRSDVTLVDKPEPVEEIIVSSSKAEASIDIPINGGGPSKSKKGKKKKKRKSNSVIDDIFGF